MKNIKKLDAYLLERYPDIWNSKIIWLLLITIPIHLLFLLIGWGISTSINILQDDTVEDYYFSSGLIFINLIVSLLLVLGWLIYMFKNNAFKHYYPIKKSKLFTDFLQYVVILFLSASFYVSYLAGGVLGTKTTFPGHVLQKEVETLNLAKAFLPQDLNDYTLMSRAYPKIFTEVYYETDEKLFMPGKVYEGIKGKFQINSTKQETKVFPSEEVAKKKFSQPSTTFSNSITHKRIKNTIVYTLKDKVLDLGPLVETTNPSFTNYSTQYLAEIDNTILLTRYSYDSISRYSNRSEKINRQVIDLLKDKDSSKLKNLLKEALVLMNKYQIKHNLTVENWYASINKSAPYEITSIFQSLNSKASTSIIYDESVPYGENGVEPVYKYESKYYFTHRNTLFSDFTTFKDMYYNINKSSHPFILDKVYNLYWIAFTLSCIILIFRTLGLRPLIFGIIGIGLLSLVVGLLSLGLYTSISRKIGEDALRFLFILFGLVVLSMAFNIIPVSKWKRSIALSMALGVTSSYVWLVVDIISSWMKSTKILANDAKNKTYSNEYLDASNLIWVLLSLLLLYFLCKSIRKWKAMQI